MTRKKLLLAIPFLFLLQSPALPQADLYSFPDVADPKVSVSAKAEKKRVDPFLRAVAQKLNTEEKVLMDYSDEGLGRGDLVRLVLLSQKSGKPLAELAKRRLKGDRMAKIAEDCKADNAQVRKQAFAILKEAEADAEKIKFELMKSTASSAAETPESSKAAAKPAAPAKAGTAGVEQP